MEKYAFRYGRRICIIFALFSVIIYGLSSPKRSVFARHIDKLLMTSLLNKSAPVKSTPPVVFV